MSTAIAVVITTKNESETIRGLVSWFVRFGHPVYVVDDGSHDHTASLAIQAGATEVYQTGGKWGIGPSLMQGWRMALANPAVMYVLQIDAGGSHQVDDFPLMRGWLFEPSLKGSVHRQVDVVIGSRFCSGANYLSNRTPWWRPLASRTMALLCNFAQGGVHWHDWSSGYRLFRREVIAYLLTKEYHARMHGWQLEVLAYAAEKGYRIHECPITYIAGRSSFNSAIAREAIRVWWYIYMHVGHAGSIPQYE